MENRNSPVRCMLYNFPVYYTLQPFGNKNGKPVYRIRVTSRGPKKSARSKTDFGPIEFSKHYRVDDISPAAIEKKLLEIAPEFFRELDAKDKIAHPLRSYDLSIELIWHIDKSNMFEKYGTSQSTQAQMEDTAQLFFKLSKDTVWNECTPKNFQGVLADTYPPEECIEINKFLRRLFFYQMELGFYADDTCKNPWEADLFKLPTHGYKLKKAQNARARVNSFDETQYKRLIAFANEALSQSDNQKMIAVAMLLVIAQVTISEICDLRKEDVESLIHFPEQHCITIKQCSRNKTHVQYPTASSHYRKIPLGNLLYSLIEQFPDTPANPYLLWHPRNRHVAVSPEYLTKIMNKQLNALIPLDDTHASPITMLRNTGKARCLVNGFHKDEFRFVRGLVPNSMGAKHYADFFAELEQLQMGCMWTCDTVFKPKSAVTKSHTWTPRKCLDTYEIQESATGEEIRIHIPPLADGKNFIVRTLIRGGADITAYMELLGGNL